MTGNQEEIRVTDPTVVMTGVKSFSTQWTLSSFPKENSNLYGCGQDQDGSLAQGSPHYFRRTPALHNTHVKSALAGSSNVLMQLFNDSTFVGGSDGWWQFGIASTAIWQTEVPLYRPLPEGLKPFGAAQT